MLDLCGILTIAALLFLVYAAIVWAWEWLVSHQRQRSPKKPYREVMLWVGDGMSPAGPYLIGTTVEMGYRRGKVVDASALTIIVEWED